MHQNTRIGGGTELRAKVTQYSTELHSNVQFFQMKEHKLEKTDVI